MTHNPAKPEIGDIYVVRDSRNTVRIDKVDKALVQFTFLADGEDGKNEIQSAIVPEGFAEAVADGYLSLKV